MTITTKIELIPICVPNYIGVKRTPKPRQGGMENTALHISELDDETLRQLGEQFTSDLLEKARNSRLLKEPT